MWPNNKGIPMNFVRNCVRFPTMPNREGILFFGSCACRHSQLLHLNANEYTRRHERQRKEKTAK